MDTGNIHEKEKYPTKVNDESEVSFDELQSIQKGFKINFIRMKDGANGKIMWETNKYDLNNGSSKEEIPKTILQCKEVVREINFSSKEKILDLELLQNFYLFGELIETNRFYFGFVIPGSTNNWEQIVEAKSPEEMLSAEVLSGNLEVETLFLSKGEMIVRNSCILYYV